MCVIFFRVAETIPLILTIDFCWVRSWSLFHSIKIKYTYRDIFYVFFIIVCDHKEPSRYRKYIYIGIKKEESKEREKGAPFFCSNIIIPCVLLLLLLLLLFLSVFFLLAVVVCLIVVVGYRTYVQGIWLTLRIQS